MTKQTNQVMPSVSFSIRFLFACCLLVATANHVLADLQHGFLWDYGYGNGAYWASRVFWGALTIVDPLAALLLFIKPRVGIALTAAIIIVDVVHNTFYVALNRQWLEPFYLSQVAFLLAVLLLAPVAWHRTARRDELGRY